MKKNFLTGLLLTAFLLSSFPAYSEPVADTTPTPTEVTQTQPASVIPQPEDTAKSPEPSETPAPADTEAITLSEAITPVVLDSSALNPPSVSAYSAVVMDAKSGTIIYTKNAHEKVYPASTTKIMTAILALEMAKDLSIPITADLQALAPITSEDSHMGLLIGETLTLEQLLRGMLIVSANDAANAIAVHFGGSIEGFAELMNKKAESLGAYNTHFTNASGVHDDNHYTTAYDITIMAQYAMKNETFREIVKNSYFELAPTNKRPAAQVLQSTNLFLSRGRSSHHIWEPVIGIKTGHTSMAGYCLVTAAQNNGNELISTVMKCDNTDNAQGAHSYTDSKRLLNFGFNNYRYTEIAKAGDIISSSKVYEAVDDTRVSMTIETNLNSLLPKNIDLKNDVEVIFEVPDQFKAPIKKGDALGTVSYMYQDQEIAYATLIAANDVELDTILFLFHIILAVLTSPFFFIPAILIIALLITRNYNKRKKQRRLRKTRAKNRAATNPGAPKKTYKEYEGKQNPNSRYNKK